MQHLPAPFKLTIFTKSSITDVRLSSKYASDKLSFSSYSKSLFVDFSLKETLTLLTMLAKIMHYETENDIGKYYY